MRRIFITGGTGFVGRAVVRQLLDQPDVEKIVCLTRGERTDLIKHPKIEYWLGDVTECRFPDADFTDLIHGANEANDLLQPDQHRYYYTIVEGTHRVLNWSRGKWMHRLIVSSGGAVRDTIYGRAKYQSERIAREIYGTKIARVFSVLGEEMPLNGQYAIGRFVHQALHERQVRVYGGTSVRTYLHVDDCAKWLVGILDSFVTHSVDVAGDTPMNIMEVAEKVAQVFDVPLVITPGPNRSDCYFPDLTAAHRLGLRQTISFDDALRRIRAHLLNPDQKPARAA